MAFKRFQIISFFLVLLVVFIVVLLIVRPFGQLLAFGAILAIMFHPLYERLHRRFKSKNLAALTTVLIILVIALIPVAFFGQIIFNDAVSFLQRFQSGDLVLRGDQLAQGVPVALRGVIEEFSRNLNSFLSHITTNIFQSASQIVSNVATFLVSVLVLAFTVFYMLRDGDKITEFFRDVSPIPTRQENELIEKVGTAVSGVVKGSFLIALLHGAVATIGLFIFGVPAPLIWGAFTVVVTLVPIIGIWLSMTPAVAYLIITGHLGSAIGLAIWACVGVLLIDYTVGPRIVGSRARLHPLLVLFSVLGGLELFGALGFLLGPIVMAIFVTLVEIYRADFKNYVEG